MFTPKRELIYDDLVYDEDINKTIQEENYQKIIDTIASALEFELSFDESILEQQERTWLSFKQKEKLTIQDLKGILNFIKKFYNLNGWWKINHENEEEYIYELTVEFFSPEELREVLKRKSENEIKINLVMTRIEDDGEEYPPPRDYNEQPSLKNSSNGWNDAWYKSNKNFKIKDERVAKKRK
jgi:thiol:disulfide interchange protein